MVLKLTSAKQKFIINKLLKKGGVLNKVASRYIESGFKVRIQPSIDKIDIIACKGGEKYGLKVFYQKKVITKKDIEDFLKKCIENSLKPVIVIYGNGPVLSQELLKEETREFLIKRIRTEDSFK